MGRYSRLTSIITTVIISLIIGGRNAQQEVNNDTVKNPYAISLNHHFDYTPNDGATEKSTTSAVDIRKLLEDYVTYLASRTEYSNEVRRMDNHRSSLSATLEKRSQYSSENRFETPLPPQWQSEVNKFSRYETIHDPVPPPTPTPANDTSEAAKVTLSVRDEELNKLIDRIFVDDPVVKSNDTVVSESREINTTTMLPSTELGESSTTPMPTTAVSTEATTRSIAPEDNSTVSTYSRSQLFSNIDEVSIVNSSKIDSERYYTGENDFMEANSTVPPLRLLLSESNVLNITAEDDNTNSNNFNTKLNELDDTELLRELKRTKELLQAQIDKLKSMQTVTLRANSEEIVDVGRMIETVTGVINATTIARPSSTTPGPVINQADLMKSPITQNVTDLQPQQPTTTVPPPPSTSTLVEIETTTAATTTTSASELETTTIIPEISESEIVTTETVWNPELTETTTLAAPPTEVTTTNFEIQTTTESVEAQFSSTIKPINGTLAGGDGLNLSNEPITVVDINLKHPGAINSLNVTQSEVGVGVEKKRDVNETDSETMILTHVPKITIIHKIHKPVVSNRSSIEEMEAYKDALRKHKELIKSTMSSIALYPAAFKQYKFNQNNKVNSVGEIYLWPNFSSLKSPHYMEVGEDNGFLTTVMPVIGPQQTMVPTLPSLMLPPTSLQSPLPPKTDPLEPKIIDEPKKRKVPKFAYKHAMNKFNRLTNDLRQTTPDHEDHDHKPPPPGNATNVANSIRIPSIPPKPYHQNYFYQLPNPQNPENILKFYRPRYRKKYKRVRIPLGYRLKKNVDSGDKPQGLFRTSPIALTIDQNNRTFERKAVSQQVVSPTPLDNDNSNSFKIFCAYDAHRSLSSAANVSVDDGGGGGQYFDINLLEQYSSVLEQCTHLVYAFASVDLTGQLATVVGGNGRDEQSRTIADPYHSNLIRIQRLKLKLPRLKILAAVGGFDTPPQLFSLMVATAKLREKLAENIFQFVLKYDFDGIIIAWFYPVFGSKSEAVRFSRSTSSAHLDDRQNLVKFIRVLRKNLDSIEAKHLEIGVLSPPFEELIDRGYDVAKLSSLVDHMILMTYDYYGPWEENVHHFAPLYPIRNQSPTEKDHKLNINHTLDYWIHKRDAPRDKTLISLAFYGRTFTLPNASLATVGSPALGPGYAGPYTNQPGLISFNELCELYLGHPSVRLQEDQYRITANVQLFDQWVGFDDELSLYQKTKYAIENDLSGVFIWPLNYDDFRNRCGWGRFPLLKAVNKAVEHCRLTAKKCRQVEKLDLGRQHHQ